ncbi:TVP38/TMEM64 family protein [Halogeometricum borinquense]|uniref:TVP38/TMEM64 family protein n=1 Tax=Halogeometricum borinquense TaxID=60847 RepID=A0A6C0UJ50_9EURY|nr:TVP38/TMEM64 family protein [Halogeometricum borinquense]QIB75564.1 TVP38/TMEM64 family protein [Halogeometricum borinquense]
MENSIGRLRTHLEEIQVFASARRRRQFLVHLLVALVVLSVAIVLLRRHLEFLTNAAELRAFIQGYGFWAPLVLVILQSLQVVAAPIPGQILALVAGYLFGAWWGTVYNVIGITIGSTVAFWLARRFGRAYVERIVHEDVLAQFDSIDTAHARLTLFLFFLVPGLPDDILCFAGGLTKIPLWQLVALAIIGRTPAFFLTNVVGGLLGANQVAPALGLAALIIATSVLGFLNRDRLVRLFGGEP